jgi:hypothetical protein
MRPVAGEDAHAASASGTPLGYVRSLKAVPSDGGSATLPERLEEVEEVQNVDDRVAVEIRITERAARSRLIQARSEIFKEVKEDRGCRQRLLRRCSPLGIHRRR